MKVTQNPLGTTRALEDSRAVDRAALEKAPPAKTEKSGHVDPGGVQISEDARLVRKAIELAHTTPEVRADKVAELKERIRNGAYQVSAESIADRLVDEHFRTDFGKNNL